MRFVAFHVRGWLFPPRFPACMHRFLVRWLHGTDQSTLETTYSQFDRGGPFASPSWQPWTVEVWSWSCALIPPFSSKLLSWYERDRVPRPVNPDSLFFTHWILQQQNFRTYENWSCRLTWVQESCHVKDASLDQLRTTLAFDLHVSIPRKNLKKTKKQSGAAAADRAPTLKSVTESLKTQREYLNLWNRAQWISVYWSVLEIRTSKVC